MDLSADVMEIWTGKGHWVLTDWPISPCSLLLTRKSPYTTPIIS